MQRSLVMRQGEDHVEAIQLCSSSNSSSSSNNNNQCQQAELVPIDVQQALASNEHKCDAAAMSKPWQLHMQEDLESSRQQVVVAIKIYI
jgi:hypothetical protein